MCCKEALLYVTSDPTSPVHNLKNNILSDVSSKLNYILHGLEVWDSCGSGTRPSTVKQSPRNSAILRGRRPEY